MADLTSLYRNKPKRDQSIQACADCLNKVALLFPNEFIKGKFTDYFDIAGGTQPPKSKFIHTSKAGYVRFLQIRDFASENTPTYIPIDSKNKLCLKDDLVLGRYGASVGKILTGKEGAYNVACAKIIFLNSNEIDKDFLFYWLHSSYFQTFLTSISRSAQGGFNKNDLSRVDTFFPSLPIQKKFVAILKKIDEAILSDRKIEFNGFAKSEIENSFVELVKKFLSFINETEELSAEFTYQEHLLKLLRQSLLKDGIQGKLVKQDKKDGNATDLLEKIKAEKLKTGRKEKELLPIKSEEIPFAIPENWVWCRLGEIALHSEAGKSYQAQEISAQENQIGVIKTSAITSGFFVEDENKLLPNQNVSIDKIRIEKDDIIFCRASGSKDLAGKSCLVTNTPRANLILSDKSIRYVFSSNISKVFIQYFNSSIFAGKYYQKLGTGKSTSMNNITREQFNNLPIPLPPLAEQKRIVKKLDDIMKLYEEMKTTVTNNQSYTEQLLQVALKDALQMKAVQVEN